MDNLTAHKASEYDQKVRQTIPFYDTIHAEIIRLVKLIKPEVKCWVDTGCGTGRVPKQALRDFPTAEFILADPAEAMLVQAQARLANCDGARLTILPPIGSTDLASHVSKGTADVVTAIQCHHYMEPPERIRALRACREVLRPGGLFVTFENIAPRTPEGIRFGLAAWKKFLMDNGRTEQEADQHIARYGKELLPITVEEHLDALAQAGFRVVELFWFSQMQAGFYAIK
jgi:tRNA (cmo5U34)-methyltransferase